MKVEIIKKTYNMSGFGDAVLNIEPINSFKFKVYLVGNVVHIVHVYKSIKSMKEDYNSMSFVDGYYVFFKTMGCS